MNFRIGTGYDVHQFTEGRDLVLGGVRIPYNKGLKGHSDADVLLHAITDAMLGALALGDIGTHFPDSDPGLEGVDSRILLKKCHSLIKKNGYQIINIDSTVIAEKPKLKEYIEPIRNSIAECLECGINQVSVKATTSEEMGFVGREEGIAAQAVVMLKSK